MKTRCRRCAPSGIHRGSIMQLRTAMLAQMPTLMSRMAITCTIQQRRAGTTQQVSAHQTSQSSTMPYPASWPKLRVGEPKSQSEQSERIERACEATSAEGTLVAHPVGNSWVLRVASAVKARMKPHQAASDGCFPPSPLGVPEPRLRRTSR